MQKLVLWVFIVVLCLFLLFGAYRAFRHEEARPAVPPTAAFLGAGFQACPGPCRRPGSTLPVSSVPTVTE
jgi:hypothetical protein